MDHPYEVVAEEVVSDNPNTLPQHNQRGQVACASPAESTVHPENTLVNSDVFEGSRNPEVDPQKTEVVFVSSGEPQMTIPTTAAPSSLLPEGDQVDRVEDGGPQMAIYSSDESDEDDNIRVSGSFSQASTLPVRSCHWGDQGIIDDHVNRSQDTLDTTSLNDCGTMPNRLNLNIEPNVESAVGQQATSVATWRKGSVHVEKEDCLLRPNVTVQDLPGRAIVSPSLQQKPDMASIQITINNTIGPPVLSSKGVLAPVNEEQNIQEAVVDEERDNTDVKTVSKPSLFTRSCSYEERMCSSYSRPVQESVMEVKA